MLNRRQKYLQIALNNTLEEARAIIGQIPLDKRIIIEAGTPLIKAYGAEGIRKIRFWWTERVFSSISGVSKSPTVKSKWLNFLVESFSKQAKQEGESEIWLGEKIENFLEEKNILNQKKNEKNIGLPFFPYIVADLKCMDRGQREVEIAREGGASAAVVLGHAPTETIDAFIEKCENHNLDAMVDMMNVEYPLEVLRQLKKLPQVVILHRGVDEETFDPESEIPYHEIYRIKENYDILIAVAGGDTFQEVQKAIFNDADIVIVWKSFYQSTAETAKLASDFLRDIR